MQIKTFKTFESGDIKDLSEWPDGEYKGFIKGHDVYSDVIDSSFKCTTGYKNAFPIECIIIVKSGHALVYSKGGILFSDIEIESEWRSKYGKDLSSMQKDPNWLKYKI